MSQENKKLVMFDFGGVLADAKGIDDQALCEAVISLSKKYILSIVSSTSSKHISNFLTERGLRSCFSDILGIDIDKNKIIKIQTLLKKYAVLPSEAIYITDSSDDIQAAKKCGVSSIVVLWGFEDKETLMQANPVAIVDNPMDLFDAIGNVLK